MSNCKNLNVGCIGLQKKTWKQFKNKCLLVVLTVCCASLGSGCQLHLRPETRIMTRELEDSLVYFMKIPNDAEFFRSYIAFNVRFTLRHKMALNDTLINKELKKELENMALVQAAQRRIDAIQQANP